MEIKDIAKKLEQLRLQANYSVYELAQKSDVSQNQITRIEHGESCPSIETLQKILEVYRYSLAEFFGENTSQVSYLSDSEQECIKLFRAMTPENKELFLTIAAVFVKVR